MLRHFVAVLLVVSATLAGPVDPPINPTEQSIIITSTESAAVPTTSTTAKPSQDKLPGPTINAFNVVSNIGYRYAVTVVSSRVKNPADVAQTAAFSVVLPETAFISGFLMEIDGKVYKAHVKEKEVAKKEYQAAVQAGQAAAHVAVSARDSNRFTVDVSIPPLQKATFNLTYEELLTRKIGVYNHVLNLHPGQIVKDMTVDVFIKENQPITKLHVPELRSGNEVSSDENDPNGLLGTITKAEQDRNSVHISFAPTPDEQRRLMDKLMEREKKDDDYTLHPFGDKNAPVKNNGIKGQFVVQYDVERDPNAAEVMVYDGYFVHFFAPADLKALPKHVVFVLDTSGSMHGRKIEQLRTAMDAILSDLKPEDFFHIINFSFAAKVWNLDDPESSPSYSSPNVHWWGPKEETTDNTVPPPTAYPATPENVRKAKEEVAKLDANGGTNIYDSLEIAMKVANRGVDKKEDSSSGPPRPEPLIIFLTDGDPTVGETSLDKIYTMVDENKISAKPPTIFALAFGDDADRGFLRKISLRNAGFMRHIYEAGDAARQLQNFYREVSSPLLAGVKFVYPKEQVDEQSLTRRSFPHLFGGSELVVAGRLAQPDGSIEPKVEATSVLGPWSTTGILLPPSPPVSSEFKPAPLERLWAYLMIKQLLDQKDAEVTSDTAITPSTKQDSPKDQALKLALKYSFVTPLTSLVVVKPNATDSSVDTETAKPGSNGGHALPLSFAAPAIPHLRVGSISGLSNSGMYYNAFQSRVAFSPKRKLAQTSFMTSAPGAFGGAVAHHKIMYPSVDRADGKYGAVMVASGQLSPSAGGPPGAPGRPAYSTPVLFEATTFRTTTFSSAEKEEIPKETLPEALSSFPWLNQYIQDGQLHITLNGTQHTLNLTSMKLQSQPDCPKALSGPGKCVPLAQCPAAKDHVTDLQTYEQFFCDVEGFAGICCDDKDIPTALP